MMRNGKIPKNSLQATSSNSDENEDKLRSQILPPVWVQKWMPIREYVNFEALGGPKIMKMSTIVNFQKGLTLPFVLMIMYIFNNFSISAYVYLALHGTYGICWYLKHLTFTDPAFERPCTITSVILIFSLVLGPYWSFPVILISNTAESDRSGFLICTTIIIHTLGLALMYGADCQKYFTLRYKKGLITDGFFKYVRHTNYTGEMMIYGSYALLVQHWIPWAILAVVWTSVFIPNMLMKEQSLSRYPEWEEYKKRTGMLLPYL